MQKKRFWAHFIGCLLLLFLGSCGSSEFRAPELTNPSLKMALIKLMQDKQKVHASENCLKRCFYDLEFVGPENLVKESREFILKNKSRINEGEDLVDFFKEEFTTVSMPQSIQNLHPIYVRLRRDSTGKYGLALKKEGMGDWIGFVVCPEGQESEGFQICDGLYWSD